MINAKIYVVAVNCWGKMRTSLKKDETWVDVLYPSTLTVTGSISSSNSLVTSTLLTPVFSQFLSGPFWPVSRSSKGGSENLTNKDLLSYLLKVLVGLRANYEKQP